MVPLYQYWRIGTSLIPTSHKCTHSLILFLCIRFSMAPGTPELQPPKFPSVKSLSESSALTSIPSSYTFTTDPNQHIASDPQDSIPVIDFSLLTSGNPDQRSKAIQDLHRACEEWGFFMVIWTVLIIVIHNWWYSEWVHVYWSWCVAGDQSRRGGEFDEGDDWRV